MTITDGYAPAECDRCERPWTHRPDTKTTAVLTGRNYVCDEHYDEAIAIYELRPAEVKKLVIDPCCTSCGLPGDVSKPLTVEQEHCEHKIKCSHKLTCGRKDCLKDPSKCLHTNHCGLNEPCEDCDHKEPGTYSTFFGASIGQPIHACDTVIDPTVTNAVHAVPAGFKANTYDQIVATGYQGQFCSVFCLAMELFLYRNRRCAGCAKRLPKDKWIAPEDSQAKAYPKYRYCGEPCEKRWHKDILTTPHVVETLGIVLKRPARERGSKTAKALVWETAA
jgi:hypothetical protein